MSALSFGEFVLDPDAREVRRGGEPVLLSPKAYQLLELLVLNRPKAFSKSTLQDRLWPDTFVVDKNLVNLIAEIRVALGDDAAHPRFVRTIHRFGYAFRDARPEHAVGRKPIHRKDARFRLAWIGGGLGLTDGEYVLGRDPELAVFLDSPDVSRRHARISVAGEQATIEDLESKNGTYVSDRKLQAATRLADGDTIRLGSFEVTFTAIRSLGSTKSVSARGR
jgi:DNA-binding winged helix-turn-helix (wHTH) protein